MSIRTLDLAIAALKNSKADLVDKEEQRAGASKGKAKSSQADEARDAEYQKQLKEHDLALDDLLTTRNKHDQEAGKNLLETGDVEPSHAESWDRSGARPHLDTADKDPYLNPLTGSYIFPETGAISHILPL